MIRHLFQNKKNDFIRRRIRKIESLLLLGGRGVVAYLAKLGLPFAESELESRIATRLLSS
jgi:hypothetical protein